MRPIYDAQFRGEIRKRMSPPRSETVTEISRATGINRQALYSWGHLRKQEGELVPIATAVNGFFALWQQPTLGPVSISKVVRL